MQTKRKSVKNLKRKANVKSKKQIGGSGLNAQLAALLSGKAKISNSRPEPINEDEIKNLLIKVISETPQPDAERNYGRIFNPELIFPEKYSHQKTELKNIIKEILKKFGFTEITVVKPRYSDSSYINFDIGRAKTYSFYALRKTHSRGEDMEIKDIPENDNDINGVLIRLYNNY